MEEIRAALAKNKQEKYALLKQMLRIANTQMTKLEEDDAEAFLYVLNQREQLIQRIDQLEATIQALSLQLSKGCQGIPTLPEVDSVDREIRDTVEKILSVDRACEAVANEKLLQYKSEFKSLKRSGQQLNLYVQPYAITNGIYIDTNK